MRQLSEDNNHISTPPPAGGGGEQNKNKTCQKVFQVSVQLDYMNLIIIIIID